MIKSCIEHIKVYIQMIKKLSIFILAISFFLNQSQSEPLSFREAKTHMPQIFSKLSKAKTIYCGCDIVFYKNGYKPDLASCGYKIRTNEQRAKRIEAEHMMPAYTFGKKRKCWQSGGRQECSQNDPEFIAMEGDLHNLYPSVGEVNGDRSNYSFVEKLKGKSPYGKCSVIINTKKQVASIPKRAKGIVARAYLYMSYTYKIPLTMDQIDLFRYWNRKYRVTRNECIRNELIKEIQGNYNPFVKLQCKNFKL